MSELQVRILHKQAAVRQLLTCQARAERQQGRQHRSPAEQRSPHSGHSSSRVPDDGGATSGGRAAGGGGGKSVLVIPPFPGAFRNDRNSQQPEHCSSVWSSWCTDVSQLFPTLLQLLLCPRQARNSVTSWRQGSCSWAGLKLSAVIHHVTLSIKMTKTVFFF